ncbi:hypothetical protein SKA23_14380 [Enterococcus faecium]
MVEDKERFMEEGDQPKSRERILWKLAKLRGKEGRLSSSFKGLKLLKIPREFQGKSKTKLPKLTRKKGGDKCKIIPR